MSIQAAAMIATPLAQIASKTLDRLPDFPRFSFHNPDVEKNAELGSSGKIGVASEESKPIDPAKKGLQDMFQKIIDRMKQSGIESNSAFEIRLGRDGEFSANSEDLELAQNIESWLKDHPKELEELKGAVEGFRRESMTPFEHFPTPMNDDRRQSFRIGKAQGELFMAWEGS